MTQTMQETAQSIPEVFETSQQVYEAVMSNALELSGFAEDTERHNTFHGKMGIVRTYLERSYTSYDGHKGYVKNEGMQESGSYKSRGGANAVMRLLERDPNIRTVCITSAGNAANGTMAAANKYGVKTRAYLTSGASKVKVDALFDGGAEVVLVDGSFENAARQTELDVNEIENAALVHAFDHFDTIAGQATVGLETLKDLEAQQERGEVDLHKDPVKIFVPVGGGGLLAGTACAFYWARQNGWIGENVQVIGVQLEGCDALRRSVAYVQNGEVVPDALFARGEFNGQADGVAVQKAGNLAALIAADPNFVADIMVVNEEMLAESMETLTRLHGQRVEPAGALSQAGARKYATQNPKTEGAEAEHLVTFITGVNVDDERFQYFMNIIDAKRQRQIAGETALRRTYLGAMYALEPVNYANWKGEGRNTLKGTKSLAPSIPQRPDRSKFKVWTGTFPR